MVSDASSPNGMSQLPALPDLGPTLARPIPALDGIRGLAILAVLLHQLALDEPTQTRALALVSAMIQSGWLGVQLFFVLSGFLITGVLLDTRRATNRFSAFYVRRALRILPLYYLLLFATFVVIPHFIDVPPAILAENRYQWQYWLYVSNWAPIVGGGSVTTLGNCWSLAIEEQFYLVWPFLVFGSSPRLLARLCVLLAACALLLRVGLLLGHEQPEILYEWTLTRMDALALGGLAAIIVREPAWLARVVPRLRSLAVIVIVALAVTAFASGFLARTNSVTQTIGHSVIALASVVLILYAVLQTARGGGALVDFLSAPLLRRFGKYSYAIYIWHLPLHLWVTHRLLRPEIVEQGGDAALVVWQLGYFVLMTTALLGIGALSHALIERPILSLKRYFTPRFPPEVGGMAVVAQERSA